MEGRADAGTTLTALEQAIANPDASTDVWLQYGQQLEKEKQFEQAAAAFQHVLETDPYSRTANLHCAAVLAQLDADRLAPFLARMIELDPRLALDVFGRPEIQPHLRHARFQTLLNQARIQSLD